MSNDKSYTLEMEVPRKTSTAIDLRDVLVKAGSAALRAVADQLTKNNNRPPWRLTIDIPKVQLGPPDEQADDTANDAEEEEG